jgi:putative sterol carrier protein
MTVDISSASDRASLAAAIAGKSDDEIERSLSGRSAQAVDQVAGSMTSHYRAAKGPKKRVVIQYLVRTPDGALPFHVTLADGRCDVAKGTTKRPNITLRMSLPNFLRLASGALRPLTALLTGRVDVAGDILLARKVQGWFE